MKEKDYEALKAKFLKAYANVLVDEQNQPIVIIEDKPYAWNRVYDEIRANTGLGRKIINKMHEVGLL